MLQGLYHGSQHTWEGADQSSYLSGKLSASVHFSAFLSYSTAGSSTERKLVAPALPTMAAPSWINIPIPGRLKESQKHASAKPLLAARAGWVRMLLPPHPHAQVRLVILNLQSTKEICPNLTCQWPTLQKCPTPTASLWSQQKPRTHTGFEMAVHVFNRGSWWQPRASCAH